MHRATCSITNTPLQALVLLNDPTYVEASRVLAQRAMMEAGADPHARGHVPVPRSDRAPPVGRRSTRILLELAQRRLDYYKKQPAQAAALIATGASKHANLEATELAAWTVVASTILNLDQTITKE